MFFGLPEQAEALHQGLAELLAAACTPATIRAAWDGSPCEELWKELGSFGALGILVEEPDGGLGLDELAMVAALEAAGYAGVPGPLVETVAYAPEHRVSLDGSARITVQAAGVEHVPYAGVATHLHREHDLAWLTNLAVEPVDSVDRSRRLGTVTGTVTQVSPGPLTRARQRATLGAAAFLVGLARRQLDLTVDYVTNRRQFGVPVGSFQGLKHPLAEAVVDLEFAWPVVLQAGYVLANGGDGAREVSHAKAAASDAAQRMSRVCLQSHGAMGYTVEYDLHLFMKRTWALARDWGSAEHHRELIAEGLL